MIEGTRATMAIHIHSRGEALTVAKYYSDLGYENRGIIPSNCPEDFPYIYFRENNDGSFTARRNKLDSMKEIVEFSDWEREVNGFNDFVIESADIVQTLFA